MATQPAPWFVTERGEALAKALLTISRKDVHIHSQSRTDSHLDLLVEISADRGTSTRFLMVQVKATTSSRKEDWIEGVKELYRLAPDLIFIPTCTFVIDVRNNQALYAWVAEPMVEANGVKLQFVHPDTFADLDRAAVDAIVERVKAWYEAMPRQLQPS